MTKIKQMKRSLEDLPAGVIRYPMTNDYMFRAVLQENTYARRGYSVPFWGSPKKKYSRFRS